MLSSRRSTESAPCSKSKGVAVATPFFYRSSTHRILTVNQILLSLNLDQLNFLQLLVVELILFEQFLLILLDVLFG